jgi:uracil DNA glycosylase
MTRWATRVATALGDALQRLDGVLRTWATAGVLLLILALVLAATVLLER